MKRAIFYLMLFLSAVTVAQSGFDAGNELYRQEKYQEAVAAYEALLTTGKHSPELYFNLGNAYYKLNKVAPAIYNFEKALLLNPADEGVRTNLGFAQKMMIDEVKEVPKVGFSALVSDFTSIFGRDTWAWFSIFAAFAILGFFGAYYFSRQSLLKRIFFSGMMLSAVLMVVSVLAAFMELQRQKLERPAIIFDAKVPVKGEPKSGAADVIILHEGSKVYVLETLDEWKRVKLPDGSDGWLESAAIKELKPSDI